jgi:hypothetical protein
MTTTGISRPELACSGEPALIPASAAEFNDFRRPILNEKVVHP